MTELIIEDENLVKFLCNRLRLPETSIEQFPTLLSESQKLAIKNKTTLQVGN